MREREYTLTWSPNKLFNHVNALSKQILNNSDRRELFRDRDGRNNESDRNEDFQRSRERDGDGGRTSKQFNIDLNK